MPDKSIMARPTDEEVVEMIFGEAADTGEPAHDTSPLGLALWRVGKPRRGFPNARDFAQILRNRGNEAAAVFLESLGDEEALNDGGRLWIPVSPGWQGRLEFGIVLHSF